MPDPSAQTFEPIIIPLPPVLPHHPKPWTSITPTNRLTTERLTDCLASIPTGFLRKQEIDLLAHVLDVYQAGLAWTDNERGTLSRVIFPDYRAPVIEHTPWIEPPIRVPQAIHTTLKNMLTEQESAGKYEYSSASYRSRIFPVLKKNGSLRIVLDLQKMNAVTIRDSALPPRPDDFAESFVGRAIYGVADLYSGFDARTLAVRSRDLTTFHSLIGPLRVTSLPQGYTNSMPEFQRCSSHAIRRLITDDLADVFIDDAGIKGPRSTYDDEPLADNSGIRRFVFEYATTLAWLFEHLIEAGFTASGSKLILATPKVQIVGSVVSIDGWHLSHGIANKVLNWPMPENLTELRGFLGVAGTGRRWIKGYSLIAKPLTSLCRKSDDLFVLNEEAVQAIQTLKELISNAPVLRSVDYDAARRVSRPPRASDEGLVTLSVDSSIHGAGWVLYQLHADGKHPAFFGSCTFNQAESRYSQPKVELYGVFRAMKEMRHRIWGCHFLLEVDAQSLKQTIKEPDLPNAPMTRWVTYIQQFDFDLQHVPATKGVAQDGLSRRRRSPDDSDEEQGEGDIDEFLGLTSIYVVRHAQARLDRFHLNLDDLMKPDAYLGYDEDRRVSVWDTSSNAVSRLGRFDSKKADAIFEWQEANSGKDCDVRIWDSNIRLGQPAWKTQAHKYLSDAMLARPSELPDPITMPFHPALLRNEDDVSYIGREFLVRKVPHEIAQYVTLGEESFTTNITFYERNVWGTTRKVDRLVTAFGASLKRITQEALRPYPGDTSVTVRDDFVSQFADLDPIAWECRDQMSTVGHTHKVKEDDGTYVWDGIKGFLASGALPAYILRDMGKISRFKSRAAHFFLYDDRLWRKTKKGLPQLVITDPDRRFQLVSEAHSITGHRGRDSTYKGLSDQFWWPNMYDDVAWHIRSCNACQYRAKVRPLEPLRITMAPTIFRRFACDTIHMGDGYGGMHYLLHAGDCAGKWIESRASKKNTARAWAKFIYEDIICRFGCIPFINCDGGPEFKEAFRILAEEKGIIVIMSSPYHPEGNGIAERDGQTLANAIWKCCAGKKTLWPLYVHAAMWAVRTTTSRSTGFTPYFLTYGVQHLLPYDIADRSWYVLDWDKVNSTEDLLAVRMQQIARRNDDIGKALDHQQQTRQRSIDDKMRSQQHRLRKEPLEPGTWVLQHETWLDNQHGNKGSLRWAGPYVVVQRYESGSYAVRELDGTLLKEKVAASRLKRFYFRDSYQSMSTEWLIDAAIRDGECEDALNVPSFCGMASACATFEEAAALSTTSIPIIDERTNQTAILSVYPDLPTIFELSRKLAENL